MLTPEEIKKVREAAGAPPLTDSGKPQASLVERLGLNKQIESIEPPKDTSFTGRLKEDFSGRQQQMVDVAARSGLAGEKKQSLPETILQGLGVGAGVAQDFLSEGAKSIFGTATSNLDHIPGFGGVKDAAHKTFSEILSSPLNKAGIEIAKQGADKYEAWKKENPRAAADVESVVNIASLIPAVKGAKVAAEAAPEVLSGVKSVASTALDAVGSSKKQAESVWKMIQPELTKIEQAEAVKAGKIKTSGVLKTIKQLPNARDKEMIEVAKPYVAKAKNELDAVANMKEGISDSATKVRSGLEQSDAIWNKNELKGKIGLIEEPITVKSDATLHNTFENLKRAVTEIAEKADKKTVGILDVRQEFDALIEREFGSKIYAKDNPMSRVIRSYRNTLNDFAESKIPEGKLPDGSSFKGELRKQTLLYNAIDNVAPKVDKIGSNAISDWVKKNPKKATAFGVLGAERIAKSLGVPFLP